MTFYSDHFNASKDISRTKFKDNVVIYMDYAEYIYIMGNKYNKYPNINNVINTIKRIVDPSKYNVKLLLNTSVMYHSDLWYGVAAKAFNSKLYAQLLPCVSTNHSIITNLSADLSGNDISITIVPPTVDKYINMFAYNTITSWSEDDNKSIILMQPNDTLMDLLLVNQTIDASVMYARLNSNGWPVFNVRSSTTLNDIRLTISDISHSQPIKYIITSHLFRDDFGPSFTIKDRRFDYLIHANIDEAMTNDVINAIRDNVATDSHISIVQSATASDIAKYGMSMDVYNDARKHSKMVTIGAFIEKMIIASNYVKNKYRSRNMWLFSGRVPLSANEVVISNYNGQHNVDTTLLMESMSDEMPAMLMSYAYPANAVDIIPVSTNVTEVNHSLVAAMKSNNGVIPIDVYSLDTTMNLIKYTVDYKAAINIIPSLRGGNIAKTSSKRLLPIRSTNAQNISI